MWHLPLFTDRIGCFIFHPGARTANQFMIYWFSDNRQTRTLDVRTTETPAITKYGSKWQAFAMNRLIVVVVVVVAVVVV